MFTLSGLNTQNVAKSDFTLKNVLCQSFKQFSKGTISTY